MAKDNFDTVPHSPVTNKNNRRGIISEQLTDDPPDVTDTTEHILVGLYNDMYTIF